MPEPAVACSAFMCRRAGTVWAKDGSGRPEPWCVEHGAEAGARRRCARCGGHKPDVAARAMLGHRVKPATSRPGFALERLLCDLCLVEMGNEQPDLWGA
jgi:hypothetical protein